MNEKIIDIPKKAQENENGKEEISKSKSFSLKVLKKMSFNSTPMNNKLFEKFGHRNSEMIPSLNNRMNPLKNCILALSFSKEIRNNNAALLNSIQSYLKTLPGFMNIISNEQSKYTMEEKLKEISINMKYEYYNKNTVMFKYGEKGDKFFIILKGKIGFLTPKKVKCNLNEEEYLVNLIKYYQNGEYEIVRNILRINQQTFDFGEDIEKYIIDTINDFYKRNKKYKYSNTVYKKLIEISNNNFQIKNNLNYNNINIQTYIDMNKPIIGNNSLKNKKPVVLYNYLYVNNYEDGQTFGYMALENRSNKRTSTAVTITDCELASLNKEEYFELLGGVHHKTRNNLYDLISSLKVLGNISKPTFDYDVIHKIKFINYKTNEIIIEEKQNLNLFYIFYNGSFKLEVNKNITGLNELIIKLKKIRGKILGIPDEIIQKDINDHLLEINGSIVNKKYSDESIKKEYLKKHIFIVSIITDNFLLGLPDTVDPDTNLTLFNCSCISNYCNGYEISNKVLKMICKGERYKFNNDVMQMSLNKINYYINRIIYYKNTLLLKIKEMEFSLNKLERAFSKQKQNNKNNINNTNIIKAEPKKYNTETNFYINKNKDNIKNKKLEKDNNINHKTLICKTSSNFKFSKIPKTKNGFKLNFMSFPNVIKNNKFYKSIQPLKRKLEKKIVMDKYEKKRIYQEIENIFHKKNSDNDSYQNEKSIIKNNIELNEEKSLENKISIRKKENKYKILDEYIALKQKNYKKNCSFNTNIYNPINEKLKENKMTLFMEYKNLINLKRNNNEENKNTFNSVNAMNNIDYFLSKEKRMKDSIFLDF